MNPYLMVQLIQQGHTSDQQARIVWMHSKVLPINKKHKPRIPVLYCTEVPHKVLYISNTKTVQSLLTWMSASMLGVKNTHQNGVCPLKETEKCSSMPMQVMQPLYSITSSEPRDSKENFNSVFSNAFSNAFSNINQCHSHMQTVKGKRHGCAQYQEQRQ